jgi:hypothetical protein
MSGIDNYYCCLVVECYLGILKQPATLYHLKVYCEGDLAVICYRHVHINIKRGLIPLCP